MAINENLMVGRCHRRNRDDNHVAVGRWPLQPGTADMKFGVFDHMDDSGISLGRQFENRMKLAEAYDRFGFHAYHLAEHHGTPLGLAPSPGLFMAALAQRTKRLRSDRWSIFCRSTIRCA